MTDETPAEFDLDSALENAYAQTTGQEPVAKPEPDNETTAVEDETPAGEKDTDQGNEPKGEPDKDQPLTPPDRWSAERKATFTALPREAQQLLLDREGEVDKAFTQKTQELAEQRKQYEAVEQVLAPRRQGLAATYGSEANALNQLFQLSDFANSDPAGFIKAFAQQRGIDLQSVQPAQSTDEYIDPVTQQLQHKISNIEQTLTQTQQYQAEIRQDKIRSEIAEFESEKDESGTPLRPHFNDVKSQMATLMGSGAAKTLKHAYEMAIWSNPTVREKILSDRQKADDTKRIEATKQAAAKAEKAKGITVKSKKDGDSTPAKAANWEDTLGDVYDRVIGAA